MKINKKMVFYILSLVLAIACMAIVFSLISRVVKDDLSSAAIFLGVAFLCEAGFNGILFFRFEDKKNRIRLSLMVLFFIIAAIFGFISTIGHYFLFSLSIFIFIIALAISRLLSIDKGVKNSAPEVSSLEVAYKQLLKIAKKPNKIRSLTGQLKW